MPHPNGQLTAEEVEPTESDHAFAQKLVREGWFSTSNKYRHVARFRRIPGHEGMGLNRSGMPRAQELLRPEFHGTPLAGYFIRLWNDYRHTTALRCGDEDLVESMELTVRQYRAFKMAGGESA